jgi:hypothetical protein
MTYIIGLLLCIISFCIGTLLIVVSSLNKTKHKGLSLYAQIVGIIASILSIWITVLVFLHISDQ